MKITDFLRKEFVDPELKARTKQEVVNELIGLLVQAKKLPKREEAVKVIMEREKLGSTGIGQGIAIPHAKVQGLKEILIVFGRSLAGVEFDSLDGEPVHLIFLLLSPPEATENLKILARISRLLKDRFLQQALKKAKNKEEIFNLIEEEEEG